MDRLIALTLRDAPVVAYIADTTQTVSEMNRIHDTTPTAAAAAGRVLTAAALMGAMLKNEDDLLTATLKCDGEIGRVVAVSDSKSRVKCEILNPYTTVRLKESKKIDVSSVVLSGTLTVIKDTGAAAPYIGQTEIVSGEIAEDFAYYFAKSEQIPSVVALGVFVGVDLEVKHAGGFIIQAQPGLDERTVSWLEAKTAGIDPVTTLLARGLDVEGIAAELFGGFSPWTLIKDIGPSYWCSCSREKTRAVLESLGHEGLSPIAQTGEGAELVCHFCNSKYSFTPGEIESMLAGMEEGS